MEYWFNCQISPLVKYRQNQKTHNLYMLTYDPWFSLLHKPKNNYNPCMIKKIALLTKFSN